MNAKLPLLLSLFFCYSISAQVIYISSSDYDLYKLDINNCAYDFVVEVNDEPYDISFHPNGKLYGISGDGNFYEIDTLSGNTNFIHDFDGQSFNSLTTAGNGLVYTIGDNGELWTYNLITGTDLFLGDIGYDATGDLTFYQGNLYAAVTNDRIVLIDIDNPGNSSVSIDENISGKIFGIVSYAEDCSNVDCYAISNGNSDIYQIDFQNSSLNFVCGLDLEVYGGASTFEFFASAPIVIDDLSQSDPSCGLVNGEISIQASGGTGQITYSIDGINFQTSGLFEDLPEGDYELIISDANECTTTEEIDLSASNSLLISDISVNSNSCDNTNWSIVVSAGSGSGQLLYSIDGQNFQSSNVFENLSDGNYTVTVSDNSGCSNSESVEIEPGEMLQINLLQELPGTCGENNALLELEGLGGISPYQYSMDGMNFQGSGLFSNLSPGNYTLTLQDSQNCTETIQVEIEGQAAPTIIDVENIPTSCGGDNGAILINASGGNSLEYSIDGINFQSSNNFENLSSGDYTVFVQDDFSCQDLQIISIESSGFSLEESIEVLPSLCGESNGSISINAIEGSFDFSINGEGFQEENGFVEQASTSSIGNLPPGMYNIQLTNEAACSQDTMIILSQEECPINIPNAFTPNEDGLNDRFNILSHPDFAGEFLSFSIFDRWGRKVYENKNFDSQDSGWDGTFKGTDCEIGVYIFYFEYISETGERKLVSGNVSLIK